MITILRTFICIVLVSISVTGQQFRISPGDTLQSLAFEADGRVTFRLFAPQASSVRVGGPDIPASLVSLPMTKTPSGVWEATIGPLAPGSYRYVFVADSLTVMDPRNPAVSESHTNSWSLLHVPGAAFMDDMQVPHGMITEVHYYSTSLKKLRRMHVYTPPGYGAGTERYPVLYLLHGAFDSDDSWSSVGRAAVILDNLIAAKKAVPMVVVMPAGHTGPFRFGAPADPQRDEFTEDFLNDLQPTAERQFRIRKERSSRAIAGLSMGGLQTLNIAMLRLDQYAHIGVFSSGIFELGGNPFGAVPGQPWEERNRTTLENASAKKGLRTVWFATGTEDFLLDISRKTVDLLKKHGFTVIYKETDGGHTWMKWREYLNEFAPLLFRP